MSTAVNQKVEFTCPNCRMILSETQGSLTCPQCARSYPVKEGIPDFRDKDEYWCNVSRERMRELNAFARRSGDWYGVAQKVVPQYAGHFAPLERADCQFLWPATKESKILDAGSMWGGIAIPAAQFHDEIYAVDKTIETLEFLNIRAGQMGLKNIYTAASGLRRLPFPDNFFDLAVLNGVLEWVAMDEEVVLEKDWKRPGFGLKPGKRSSYAEDARSVQLDVLREMRRVLKPGGALYLAIENAVGYIYLAGHPDDHMNLPFISFMPRAMANAVTKLMLNCEYRTYVYSIPGYRRLIEDAGFRCSKFYGAFMHYINPSQVVPLRLIKDVKDAVVEGKAGKNRILLKLIPKKILAWLSPSVIAIMEKSSGRLINEPRLVQLLRKAGVIGPDITDVDLIKWESRPGDALTANYAVYLDNAVRPKYFCKICRSKDNTAVIDAETKNLKIVYDLLKDTDLLNNIPVLGYSGRIDGITFMVTKFITAQKSVFLHDNRLKKQLPRLDKEIRAAIEFIVRFQKSTTTRAVDAKAYLMNFVGGKEKILRDGGMLTDRVKRSIDKLYDNISLLGDISFSLCAQQGDYDFFKNIMFDKDGVRVLDFEHFKQDALPFLDIATLVYNPILLSREHQKQKMPLSALLGRYGLKEYVDSWFHRYMHLADIPETILPLIVPIAALEQMTDPYPVFRDPKTFPINTAFHELMDMYEKSA